MTMCEISHIFHSCGYFLIQHLKYQEEKKRKKMLHVSKTATDCFPTMYNKFGQDDKRFIGKLITAFVQNVMQRIKLP